MTVVALAPRRAARQHRYEPAEIRLSFEVTLAGDTRFSDAVDVIDGLRRLTDHLGSASLVVGPAPDAEPQAAGTDAIRIYPESHSVHLGARPVDLTKVEYDLISFLAQYPRMVFTRIQLLRGAWGHQHVGERTVDVHVRRVRAKLGEDLITTVRGVGYRLADDAPIRIIQVEAGRPGATGRCDHDDLLSR